MLTASEVRKRLKIGPDKFRELVQTGQLVAMRTGTAHSSPYRVSEEALAAYIASKTVQPAKPSRSTRRAKAAS